MYVGMMIYGFCNGYFGRDSYDDKRIEAVGNDWIVARAIDTHREPKPEFASFENREQLEELCQEWAVKPKEG